LKKQQTSPRYFGDTSGIRPGWFGAKPKKQKGQKTAETAKNSIGLKAETIRWNPELKGSAQIDPARGGRTLGLMLFQTPLSPTQKCLSALSADRQATDRGFIPLFD
jgi:hypothetical protein